MILCIDKKSVNTDRAVQRKVDLDDLLKNHTKYFDTEEEALQNNFVPLDFCVSVRSMYSNLVVENTTKEGNKICYINLVNIEKFVHQGQDLIMYLASLGILHSINYKIGFDELMFQHSQIQPIGVYNPDPEIMHPIIYSHIILSDVGIEVLRDYLIPSSSLIPISEIKEGSIKALVDTLIIVKEEDSQCQEAQ